MSWNGRRRPAAQRTSAGSLGVGVSVSVRVRVRVCVSTYLDPSIHSNMHEYELYEEDGGHVNGAGAGASRCEWMVVM